MPSIFEQPWWLEICASDNWRCEFEDTEFGRLAFTYIIRQRGGFFREITRPPLTPFLGLSLDVGDRSPTHGEAQNLLCRHVPFLLDKLPKYHRFKLNFHPDFTWWSPFFWKGFNQHTRYSYRLKGISDTQSIWKGFNSNARRNIKKAEKSLVIDTESEASVLYRLFEKTMDHQGKKTGYQEWLLTDLVSEAKRRGNGAVLICRDEEGTPHSGVFLVWYNRECYYLVGGTDPELRKSGAMMMTMWHAIQYAAKYADIFDFEGSMQPGIDRFLRNFGGYPVPYYQISKPLWLT